MIAAVIFDLDGTVLDNESLHEEAFQKVVVKNKLVVKPQLKNGWIHEPGIGVAANWQKLLGHEDLNLTKQTWTEYLNIISQSDLPIRDGLVELVEVVKDLGWPTALATSSEWHNVEQILEDLDLYLAFDITTTGEEVFMAKPDPEIYLLTAQKLGVEPGECLVIEDSLAGVEAAKAAGMQVVGIASGYATREDLKTQGANLVVDSLNEIVVGLAQHGGQNQNNSQSH